MGLLVLSSSSLLSPRWHQLFPGGGGGGGGGGLGWEIVDAFLFLIIEEGRGLYSVFTKSPTLHPLIPLVAPPPRGFFRVVLLRIHEWSFVVVVQVFVKVPPSRCISGSLPGSGETAPRNHHLCYDTILV